MTKKRLLVFAAGILAAFLVIEAGLWAFGLAWKGLTLGPFSASPAPAAGGEHMTVVCIGESMTACQGPTSYPHQLEDILNAQGMDCRFTVVNRGLACTSSIANLNRLEADIDACRPAAVIAMLGINEIASPMVREHVKVRFSHSWWKKIKTLYLFHSLWLEFKSRRRAAAAGAREPVSDRARMLCGRNEPLSVAAYRGFCRRAGYAPSQRLLSRTRMLDWALADGDGEAVRFWKALSMACGGRAQEARLLFAKTADDGGRFADSAAAMLAVLARRLDDGEDVRVWTRRCLEMMPGGEIEALREIGYWCTELWEKEMGEEVLSRALALEPEDAQSMALRGVLCFSADMPEEGESWCLKALEADPDNLDALLALGFALNADEQERGFAYLCRLLSLDPNSPGAMVRLAAYYWGAQRPVIAAALMEKGLYMLPGDDVGGNKVLGRLYDLLGRGDKDAPALDGFIANYRAIRRICDRRGVQLVCMQYPMRPLAQLRSIFRGEEDGIVFVDNMPSFSAALAAGASYDDLFMDRFADDFGHCTKRGNRIMAENAARALLRRFFKTDLRGD